MLFKKLIITFSLLFLAHLQLFSQNPKPFRTYKGNVIDSVTGTPLKDVSVCIYRASDTSLLQFGFTTPLGNYQLTVTSNDSLLITYSLLNYDDKTFKKPTFKMGDRMFFNDQIKLKQTPYQLKSVKISASAIRMKGDTMEINANKFKVLPGSDVAQLFKKIPGFEVNVKGEIKVDGATVSKIMVDGSDFFGNNPGLVSKNLNADMIDAVQVYEPKNLDGTPTESQDKVINLKLKKNKKNGLFGDAIAGYGTNKRYEGGLRLNGFKDDRKLSAVFNANNINGTGFDFGFSNWHRSERETRNGSSSDFGRNFFTTSNNSSGEGNINNNITAATTFFNEYRKFRKLSITADVGQNAYNTIQSSKNINALNDSTQRFNIDSNHLDGLIRDAKIQSDYSKKYDSTGEFTMGVRSYFSLDKTDVYQANKILFNETINNSGFTINKGEKQDFNNRFNLSLFRKLRKDIRYFYQVSSTVNYNINDNNQYQYTENQSDTFNNYRTSNNTNTEWLLTLSGGMPIYKNFSFSLKNDRWYDFTNYNQTTKDAQLFSKKDFNQNYNNNVDSLSLKFKNTFEQLSSKPSINYDNKNGTFFSFGTTLLKYNIVNENLSSNLTLNKTYNNVLPFAMLHYRHKKTFMMLNASQTITFPTINDLAPIINLSNTWQRNIGNPDLQPVKKNTISARYVLRQVKNLRSLFTNFQFENSSNAKVYVNTMGNDGKIIQKPVNASGYYNFTHAFNASYKLYKIVFLNLGYNYSNGQKPYIYRNINSSINTEDFTANPGLNITFSDSLELNLNSSFTYNKSKNELNKSLNYNQFTNSYSASVRTLFRTGTELNTEFSLLNRKNIPGFGRLIYLWNIYLQQPISKNGKYNLKLTAYDILKQNTSITRTTTNGYINIQESNQLQQYFMLSLIYKIKPSSNNNNNDVMPGRMHMRF